MRIPFNIPVVLGSESGLVSRAIASKKLSGNGAYTKRCQQQFETKYGIHKSLLTTSCTDALELAALVCDIKPGDEVILPSYTFPSTANAFFLRGATLVFADSSRNHPNLELSEIERLITPRTRVVIPVHYAGNACDMDALLQLQTQHGFFIVEDAAQAIDATYKGDPLGSIGDFGTFSYHDTKNISCGEGGMLCINNKEFVDRSEILWEKGTNRQAFLRGDIEKYGWVDIGSSYYPSELNAAFLSAQLDAIETIQTKRVALWNRYKTNFASIADRGHFTINQTSAHSSNNGHIFYVVFQDSQSRQLMIEGLKQEGIGSAFHYQSLHRSVFFKAKHDGRALPNSDRFSDGLLRLPLFYDLTFEEVDLVCEAFAKTIQGI